MTNYITSTGFTTITGIGWQEAGESASNQTAARDDRITEAQTQFEHELDKTFDGSEDDYTLVQRAVSFLAAHLIRLQRLEVIPSTPETSSNVSSPYLQEYKRLVALLRQAKPTDEKPVFHGMMDTITSDDV